LYFQQLPVKLNKYHNILKLLFSKPICSIVKQFKSFNGKMYRGEIYNFQYFIFVSKNFSREKKENQTPMSSDAEFPCAFRSGNFPEPLAFRQWRVDVGERKTRLCRIIDRGLLGSAQTRADCCTGIVL
jgi:hypothetical protein